MRDSRQQQTPVLIMPVARASEVLHPGPTQALPAKLKPERHAELQALRDFCSTQPELCAAVPALTDLLGGDVGPPASPGWLGVEAQALTPVVSTDNPIFPHLPVSSYELAVTFHRKH